MPEAKLVILNGPYDGTIYEIAAGTTLIGASSEATVRIGCDPDFPNGGIRLTMDEKGLQYENCETQAIQQLVPGTAFTVGQTQFAIYIQSGPQENPAERKETNNERAAT
jgi:hypothetical protein